MATKPIKNYNAITVYNNHINTYKYNHTYVF